MLLKIGHLPRNALSKGWDRFRFRIRNSRVSTLGGKEFGRGMGIGFSADVLRQVVEKREKPDPG